MREMREWDLVRTHDGYYGVVTSVKHRSVFLSNGCEAVLNDLEWSKLDRLPLNIFHQGGEPACFIGLGRTMRGRE